MMNDARFLDGLYRQQYRSDKISTQIEEDIANGGGEEELSIAFEKIMQAKASDSISYTVSAAYVSYKHETAKSAVNVV